MPNKILIIGGLHGNEPLGIEIVRYFLQSPTPNITCEYGNPEAIELNTRFKDLDLNRVFPSKENGQNSRREEHTNL
jgi:succinylglutamate desuccinylase